MSTENKPEKFYTLKEMADQCQKNGWLKQGGYDFEDEHLSESDYDYCLYTCQSLEELEQKFKQGNWSIRQGFAYKQLLFVNQVNAGDEWWTNFKHSDGRIEDFESITFARIIADGEFEDFINRLLKGPDIYWDRDKKKEA